MNCRHFSGFPQWSCGGGVSFGCPRNQPNMGYPENRDTHRWVCVKGIWTPTTAWGFLSILWTATSKWGSPKTTPAHVRLSVPERSCGTLRHALQDRRFLEDQIKGATWVDAARMTRYPRVYSRVYLAPATYPYNKETHPSNFGGLLPMFESVLRIQVHTLHGRCLFFGETASTWCQVPSARTRPAHQPNVRSVPKLGSSFFCPPPPSLSVASEDQKENSPILAGLP